MSHLLKHMGQHAARAGVQQSCLKQGLGSGVLCKSGAGQWLGGSMGVVAETLLVGVRVGVRWRGSDRMQHTASRDTAALRERGRTRAGERAGRAAVDVLKGCVRV